MKGRATQDKNKNKNMPSCEHGRGDAFFENSLHPCWQDLLEGIKVEESLRSGLILLHSKIMPVSSFTICRNSVIGRQQHYLLRINLPRTRLVALRSIGYPALL